MTKTKKQRKNGEIDVAQPKLKFAHPNAKGTGSLVEMWISPGTETFSGSLMVTFARQKTTGGIENGNRILPTFDHANKICVKLTVFEVGTMLQVFDGFLNSIEEGKGFFHKSAKGHTVVTLEHILEPIPGYLFSVSRKPIDGELQRQWIRLSPSEAFTLSYTLKQALLYMAFGTQDSWSGWMEKSAKETVKPANEKIV